MMNNMQIAAATIRSSDAETASAEETIVSDVRSFALVTGASSGIGAAYAERLAERGHDLILVARRRDRLEALAAQLRQDYGRVVEVHPADLGDPDDLARIETLLRSREEIDVLVNNAGLGAIGPSVAADPDAVETLVRVNVLALTRLCLAATPRFSARGHGTIINIGSVIGVIPWPAAAAYSGLMANKRAVLPGFGIKIVPFLLRFFPRGFILAAVGKFQMRRR